MRTILQVFVDVKGRAEASGRGEGDGVVRRVLSDDTVLCGMKRVRKGRGLVCAQERRSQQERSCTQVWSN